MTPAIKQYALTIKYVKKDIPVTPSTYEPFLALLISKGCTPERIYYESDSKGVCHVHGFLVAPSTVLLRKMKIPGYTVRYVDVYDEQGWSQYCKKDQDETVDPPDNIKLTKKLFKH